MALGKITTICGSIADAREVFELEPQAAVA